MLENIENLTKEVIQALQSIQPKMFHNYINNKYEIGVVPEDIPEILKPYFIEEKKGVFCLKKTLEKRKLELDKIGYKGDWNSFISEQYRLNSITTRNPQIEKSSEISRGKRNGSFPKPSGNVENISESISRSSASSSTSFSAEDPKKDLYNTVDTLPIYEDILVVDYAKLSISIALTK